MPAKFTFEQKILQGVSLLMTDDDFMADIRVLQEKYRFPAPPEQREKNGTPKHLLDVFEPLKKSKGARNNTLEPRNPKWRNGFRALQNAV